MEETVSNQLMQLRNKLVSATKIFARMMNLSLVLIPTLSRDMGEQFKLAQMVFDVVDRDKRKVCVTLLR